ncbi:MAG: methyltransferase, partial [Bryobacteraceae bacterium]
MKLRPLASQLKKEHGFDRYDSLRPELDSWSLSFISEALRHCGWAFKPGSSASTTELSSGCGIAPAHAALFARLLEILADEGILQRNGDSWRIVKELPPARSISEYQTVSLQYPAFSGETEMLGRCGVSLGPVLQGKANPLQLLFPDGSFDCAERIYSHSPAPQVFNRLAREAIREEVDSRAGASIRVLEIGAGTGGTTAYVLDALPADRTTYTWTDVSALFCARAEEKFKSHRFVEYRTLDIERDPAAQGFPAGDFDIILAANVLHATADLRSTMRHVRGLLAPGGIVVLVEGTAPERWVDLTFGLTQGWWNFTDHDLRPSYPLIPGETWKSVLNETGFCQPELVQPAEGSQQAVVLARAAKPTVGTRWLIVPDRGGFANALAARLQQEGAETTFHADGSAFDYVCYCAGLDASLSEDTTLPELEASVNLAASGLLSCAQEMMAQQANTRLWLVTRGAQPVTPGQSAWNAGQAPAWGLAKTISLEHADTWGGSIDVDPDADLEFSAQSVVDCILHGHDQEDELGIRNGIRYVARLTRCPAPPPRTVSLRPEQTYLITGGLGGLGLQIAQWMIEH